MTPRTITGSKELGTTLRNRREELNLTIERAARAAAVGSETWRRYEIGGSIRRDKLRGICTALRWRAIPGIDDSTDDLGDLYESWEDYPKEKFDASYSDWLAKEFGHSCAQAFAFGCDILRDQISDDLSELAKRRRDTHLGELDVSWLEGTLPPQWVPRYDYEFLFRLRCTVDDLRLRVMHPGYDGIHQVTRSVADDLALHLILEAGMSSAEGFGSDAADDWQEWEYQLNGEDDESIYLLYSNTSYADERSPLHFDRWFDVVHHGLGEEPESA